MGVYMYMLPKTHVLSSRSSGYNDPNKLENHGERWKGISIMPAFSCLHYCQYCGKMLDILPNMKVFHQRQLLKRQGWHTSGLPEKEFCEAILKSTLHQRSNTITVSARPILAANQRLQQSRPLDRICFHVKTMCLSLASLSPPG